MLPLEMLGSYHAYWYRREVSWDPAQWRFGDGEANAWLDYERRAGYELPAW